MANAKRGEISVTVGGKTYVLRPAFQTMLDIEDFVGLNLLPLTARLMEDKAGTREICGIIMVAALANDPDADRDAFLQAMVDDGVGRFVKPAFDFVQGFMLGGKEGNGDAAAAPRKPKGIPSAA